MLDNYNYSILYCYKCKFFWQEYIPSDELCFELYEKWIDPEVSKKKALLSQSKYSGQVKSILTCFKMEFPEKGIQFKFLDYGAGWGGWSSVAINLGMEVNSLEISPTRISFLKQNKITTVSTISPYKSYNLILLNQVLEHIPDFSKLLSQLNNSLDNKGYLIISVPDCKSLKRNIYSGKLEIGKNQLHPIEHLNGFTNYSLSKLMKNHGFMKISLMQGVLLNIKNLDFFMIKRVFSFIFNQLFSTTIIFQKIK